MHRSFSRIVTKSYNTVSNEAAGVLAGLLPLDLEIERCLATQSLKRNEEAVFQNERIAPGTFDTITHAKEYLRLKAEDIWQARWDESTKGRITHQFYPRVGSEAETVPRLTFQMNQILTGHGDFMTHLKRIGKSENDLFPQCLEEDSPIHRIMDCPLYLAPQEEILDYLGDGWPPDLTKIPFIINNEIFTHLLNTEDNL